jgi:hypothetical protein
MSTGERGARSGAGPGWDGAERRAQRTAGAERGAGPDRAGGRPRRTVGSALGARRSGPGARGPGHRGRTARRQGAADRGGATAPGPGRGGRGQGRALSHDRDRVSAADGRDHGESSNRATCLPFSVDRNSWPLGRGYADTGRTGPACLQGQAVRLGRSTARRATTWVHGLLLLGRQQTVHPCRSPSRTASDAPGRPAAALPCDPTSPMGHSHPIGLHPVGRAQGRPLVNVPKARDSWAFGTSTSGESRTADDVGPQRAHTAQRAPTAAGITD